MGALSRLITSIFEANMGRIHTYPNCWILSKYEWSTKLIKSKGIRVGDPKRGSLIERKDSDGDTMVLIKRRGVLCPNLIYFVGRSVQANGRKGCAAKGKG
jgi:hypothetical protein